MAVVVNAVYQGYEGEKVVMIILGHKVILQLFTKSLDTHCFKSFPGPIPICGQRPELNRLIRCRLIFLANVHQARTGIKVIVRDVKN